MLLGLPNELFHIILNYLELQDIKSLGATCRFLWSVTDSRTVFQDRVVRVNNKLGSARQVKIRRRNIVNLSFPVPVLRAIGRKKEGCNLMTKRFPNLESLTLEKGNVPSDLQRFCSCEIKQLKLQEITSFRSFVHDLENANNPTSWSLTLHECLSTFKKLTILKISFDVNITYGSKALENLLNCIQALPDLKELELRDGASIFQSLDTCSALKFRHALLEKGRKLTFLGLINSGIPGDLFETVFCGGPEEESALPKSLVLLGAISSPLKCNGRDKFKHVESLTINAGVPGEAVFSQLPSLAVLSIVAMSHHDSSLLQQKDALKRLTLENGLFSAATMNRIIYHCGNIRTFMLKECWFQEDGKFWLDLVVKMPKLQWLYIYKCINFRAKHLAYMFLGRNGVPHCHTSVRKITVCGLPENELRIAWDIVREIKDSTVQKIQIDLLPSR